MCLTVPSGSTILYSMSESTFWRNILSLASVLRSGERVELVRLLKKVGMWAAARLDDKQ